MTIEVARPAEQPAGSTRRAIADCDIHHTFKAGMKGLFPYLKQRWRDHLDMLGPLPRPASKLGLPYLKTQPDAARRDPVRQIP